MPSCLHAPAAGFSDHDYARLLIRPHSAVELADRAQDAGLITRRRDPDQHSQVRLSLTEHDTAPGAGEHAH